MDDAVTNEQLAAEYAMPTSLEDLVEIHGIPYRQVRQRLLAGGVTLRPAGEPPLPMPGGLDKAYADGTPIRKLADYHGISYSRVRRHLLSLGVELRPRGPRT